MKRDDYLEIKPQKKEILKKYISEGKLAVGPWFCLPDEFCVGGESLIRNLLLGHKIANEFGKVSKTGYSPFGWGQISQMPQLYTFSESPFFEVLFQDNLEWGASVSQDENVCNPALFQKYQVAYQLR